MIALPVGCAVGLLWANTLPESYFITSHQLTFVINDIGMAFFLALVTKEVVEATLTGGVLHPWRRAALPLVAAICGVALPIAGYNFYLQQVGEWMLMSGWLVPSAVDIAAVYVLARLIFGRGPALPFLLLIAIASDVIGLVAMAVWHPIDEVHVGVAVGLLALGVALAIWLRGRHVRTFWPYVFGSGTLAWFGLYLGGVHPALALVPIVPFLPHAKRDAGLFIEPAVLARDSLSVFSRWWTPPVQVVLLLFGIINAGVPIRGLEAGTWAVPLASIVGRPLGTLLGAAIAVALGLHLPQRLGWRELTVIGVISSVGLTMSLFFATVALPPGPLLLETKMGALLTAASAVVALGLATILRVGRFKGAAQ
jgi:NhaA family Na+:H+ antiporter